MSIIGLFYHIYPDCQEKINLPNIQISANHF